MAEAALGPYAQELADAAERALPGWVERSVERIAAAWSGTVPDEVRVAAVDAGERARDEVGFALRRLLRADIDAQPTNPLSVLRGAIRYPTAVLVAAGVPPVRRDPFKERSFPADVYDLTPATWADLDESLHDPGLYWSAWKASEHLRRRRAEGRR